MQYSVSFSKSRINTETNEQEHLFTAFLPD